MAEARFVGTEALVRLENEHTHYRSRFVMSATNQNDEVAPYVLQVIYNWICGKEEKRSKDGQESWLLGRLRDTAVDYHKVHPESASMPCHISKAFMEGMQFPKSYDGGAASGEDSKLCSRSFVGDSRDGFPRYWAMDYDEPDGSIWARRWHTSVGIVSEGARCVVNVRITNYLVPGYVGNSPKQPESTTPNFVRSLVALESCRTLVGNMVVGERPVFLTPQNYADFIRMLVSDRRELPMIVVASDHEGRLPINVKDLAYKVLGMARVFVLRFSDTDLRAMERKAFVKGKPSWEFRTRPGFVRVYKPHMKATSNVDATRHRYFGPDDIERYGTNFNNMLSKSLTRSWAQNDEDVVDVLDIRSLTRRARNAELRERLERLSESSRQASSTRQVRRHYEQESNATIEELRRLLEERDKVIDELEENGQFWQDLANEYAADLDGATELADEERSTLKAQVAGYISELADKESEISDIQDRLSKKEYEAKSAWAQIGELNDRLVSATHALQSFEDISHVPGCLSELLDLLAHLYPGRVCVLEEARKSAQDFDGRYVLDDEWQILKSVPTVLWGLYFGQSPSQNIPQDYQIETGFELALTEGSMTNKGGKYAKQRLRTYRGEGIYVYPHIKGHSNSTKDAFRVHYYVDRKSRIIVIGHCGAHLDTAGTSKAKH